MRGGGRGAIPADLTQRDRSVSPLGLRVSCRGRSGRRWRFRRGVARWAAAPWGGRGEAVLGRRGGTDRVGDVADGGGLAAVSAARRC